MEGFHGHRRDLWKGFRVIKGVHGHGRDSPEAVHGHGRGKWLLKGCMVMEIGSRFMVKEEVHAIKGAHGRGSWSLIR